MVLYLLAQIACSPYPRLTHQHLNKFIVKNSDTLKTGRWVEYVNEQTIRISKYKHGKKNGKSQLITNYGGICYVRYKNDKHHGWSRCYSSDGSLCSERLYKNGENVRAKEICGPKW